MINIPELLGQFVSGLTLFLFIKLIIRLIGFKKPIHLFNILIVMIFMFFLSLLGMMDLNTYTIDWSNESKIRAMLSYLAFFLSYFIFSIDNKYTYDDPESENLKNITVRFWAAMIDISIVIFIITMLIQICNNLNISMKIQILLTMIILILYFIGLEIFAVTIGKKICKLKIVLNDKKTFLSNSIVRNTFKLISVFLFYILFESVILIPIFCFLNLFSIHLCKNKQAWYDKLCSTNVDINKKIIQENY